ncbi:DUF5954 family protein [Yinghuangia aomiensis]
MVLAAQKRPDRLRRRPAARRGDLRRPRTRPVCRGRGRPARRRPAREPAGIAGGVHQLCRTRRLVRWGPDGPEGPRPSDVNSQDPAQLHPRMDDDGNVLSETVTPEG